MSTELNANDIAIIGLALRVPGARNAGQFWENLREGIESIESRTPSELQAAGESPAKIRRKDYVPYTAELPGMADFDAEFFGFSPKDAAVMDPQHRHFLECVWEALEDATRMPDTVSGRVGVFAGCGMGSYFYFNVCSHRQLVEQTGMFMLRHTGNDKDFLSTRVSYLLDLHGPSVNIQTACSTSLVAVHYACQSLLSGECDMAVAGGVTIEQPHGRGYLYQEGEILSPDGHCRAFDHRAAGTVFGSGAGVVILRRLSEAIADGDPIRAVIKATAINNDGSGKASYLAPSVTGQSEAIVEAHALAGVTADSIQYVECHGTGTSIGDPIEIAALTEAFRLGTDKTGFCRVGSVKTNIGHLDTAAGVVSLIKATLAIENGEIPPSLGYEAPNPAIDFDSSPFVVADKLTPWPRTDGPRRAGVNSLGVGGTNAHAVIEQAPSREAKAVQSQGGPQLLLLSGRNRRALDDGAQRLASYIEASPDRRLEDIAYTLTKGRKQFSQRRVYAVADRADAISVLSQADTRRGFTHTPIENVSGAVLLFPGGGAQYPGMGRKLYEREPVFAKIVDEGLSYLPDAMRTRIRELWLGTSVAPTDAATELLRPSLQLPAILIIEVALARLWQSWDLKPTALIGHSMGEYAAACIAGVMTFERAVRLVQLRGELFDEIDGGGMLSVQLSYDHLRELVHDTLDIGVVNAPELCVVSGPAAELEAFRQKLTAQDVTATAIPINIAAHSRMLEPILARFEAFLRETPLAAPKIPIVSNLTGTWMKDHEATDPTYWVRHLRSTVRFAEGMATLAADKTRVYIEAGPGRTLSSLAKAQGPIDANAVINSLPHAEEEVDDRLYFLAAVGRAWATGLNLPVERLSEPAEPKRVHLPTYAFQHQRYFFDEAAADNEQRNAAVSKNPDIADWGWAPTWKAAYADRMLGDEKENSSFLVFLDDAGVGEELVSRLRQQNRKVMTVALGDVFAVKTDGSYVLCPETSREGYDALIRHLWENGGIPDHIIHSWLVTADEYFRPGSSFFHRNQERGFYSLLFLGQALGEVDLVKPLQITVLSNGMQRVGAEQLRYPEKATALGPAQVLPRELKDVNVRIIDIPFSAIRKTPTLVDRGRMLFNGGIQRDIDTAAIDEAVDAIWDDVLADHGSEIVACREGRRWVRSYRQVRLDPAAGEAGCFQEKGIYLITGGLGDLALACALDLAKSLHARIALMGRLELPDRASWLGYLASRGNNTRVGRAISAILDIEAAGGEVLYVRADITNPELVRQAVRQVESQFGKLNGVLHASGVVKDNLIQLKSVVDVEDVLAPKVLGTMVLTDVLKDEPLDLLVLFSSTSTDTAPAGQADYVAANAYLNAYAESRTKTKGPHVVALHWGVWSDVGLAARAIRQAVDDAPAQTVDAAKQPLFEERIHEDGAEGWLTLRASADRQWLLDEHRLKTGEAIWPGTGYLELVAEAAREFGVQGAIEIKNLTFLRPLYVPDDVEKLVHVVVKREANQLRVAVESHFNTKDGEVKLRHAEAIVGFVREPQLASIDVQDTVRRFSTEKTHSNEGVIDFVQARHLRTGPRWRLLREVHLSNAGAFAKLQLDEAFRGDHSAGLLVHPSLADLATGYAMELIPGYDPSKGLWVPASYGRVRLYHALPPTIWSLVKLSNENAFDDGFATFDVTITDDSGRVVAMIESFTVRHLDLGTNFSAAVRDISGAVPVETASQQGRELLPGLARLAAQVDQGILPEEGGEALRRAVATGLPEIIVSSIDLKMLQESAAERASEAAAVGGLARPTIDSEFVGPETEIERTLAGFWTELLGIEKIGVADNFFDLGGHSLIAVRFFRMIKKAYSVEFPISVLFEAPTIGQCAKLIEQSSVQQTDVKSDAKFGAVDLAPKVQFKHVVSMHAGRHPYATPLFVCAGMFGNVLNLRHLALHIGQDRPVYGLQARGLYGGEAPHETFEEMAASYLEEVRAVQPHGPYLLGGFSGGGLVAFEMAQQLRDAGELVDLVVLLDTPYPEPLRISLEDRVSIRLQDIKREGTTFFTRWFRDRVAFELMRMKKTYNPDQPTTEQFHNSEIEAAFLRALFRYRAKSYDQPVLLLRPKQEVFYRMRDGRNLNRDRATIKADNGWTPYLANLNVVEVSGDHDSMVLEPMVRLLAARMREALRSAEQSLQPTLLAAE